MLEAQSTHPELGNPKEDETDERANLEEHPEECPNMSGYDGKEDGELGCVRVVGFSEETVVCDIP